LVVLVDFGDEDNKRNVEEGSIQKELRKKNPNNETLAILT
jgi:hypothetical protein